MRKLKYSPVKKIFGPFVAFLEIIKRRDLLNSIYNSSEQIEMYKTEIQDFYVIILKDRLLIWNSTLKEYLLDKSEIIVIPFSTASQDYYLVYGGNYVLDKYKCRECIKKNLYFKVNQNDIAIFKDNVLSRDIRFYEVIYGTNNYKYNDKEIYLPFSDEVICAKLYKFRNIYSFLKIENYIHIVHCGKGLEKYMKKIAISIENGETVFVSNLLPEHSKENLTIEDVVIT